MILTISQSVGISINLRMDNMAALPYLMKMGGTIKQEIVSISKKITLT